MVKIESKYGARVTEVSHHTQHDCAVRLIEDIMRTKNRSYLLLSQGMLDPHKAHGMDTTINH